MEPRDRNIESRLNCGNENVYMIRSYGNYMYKRTTIILDSSIYEELIKESISKYGDARHLSAIINEKLRSSTEDYTKIFQMARIKRIYAENLNETENFRSNLSMEFEN